MLPIKSFALCLSLLLALPSLGAEIFEPFQSVRQLGMGGVYVFDPHDAGGFMQNPAYTCFSQGMNFSLFDVGIGVGDVQALMDLKTTTSSAPNPGNMVDLAPYYGKNIWVNAGGFSSVMFPCFGVAYSMTGIGSFSMHNPAYPTLNTFYFRETGYRVGGAIPLTPNVAFGIDLKRVDRTGGPSEFGPDSLATMATSGDVQSLATTGQNQGSGYGADVGLVSRFADAPFNPTMSLSWKDVGSTAYLKSGDAETPERQKDNLVLGATVDGSIPLLGFAAGLEYRHITDVGEQIGKKLHLGAEVSLAFLDLRAGLYQGYRTYGLGIDLWLLQLDAALYSVERGVYPGQTPDQRFQIGIQMDLEFDPDFKFVDAGGKKRRLKQRR